MTTAPTQPLLSTEPLRIVGLQIDNVKVIRVVNINPPAGDPIVRITGKNGQGKSTVLDSIAYAIGGTKLHPEKPIRKGAKSASVVVDLGELVVKRTWNDSGNTYIDVRARDGSVLKSPQAVLDRLVGDLAFDPLAFTRLDDKARLAVLKGLSGVANVIDDLDRERQQHFEARTLLNRELAIKELVLRSSPVVEAPDAPVSIAALAQEHAEATETIQDNADKRTWLESAVKARDQWAKKVSELQAQLAKAQAGLAEMTQAVENEESYIRALVDPDVAAIAKRMGEVEGTNALVSQKLRRAAAEREVIDVRTKAAAETRAIEECESRKEAALAGAKMPVEGLAFTDAGVTLNGVPFSQASTAEQLGAGVKIGFHQNPRLRVMLVREGSLLDGESMALLAKCAEEHNAQVWVEQVTDGGPVGVVIQDGMVAETGGGS